MTTRIKQRLGALFSLLIAVPAAHAQWAVVDVGAIAQLVQQVQTTRQQLTTARDQLTQAQREFDAMTGGRGMQSLLAGTVRNYLPPDWEALESSLGGGAGSYSTLGRAVRTVVAANAVLTDEQLANLAATERDLVGAARRSAAMLQATTRQALQNSSSRFVAIQQLIDAIPSAADQKAILDLQARIAAEQGMLVNEQTKLDVLQRAAQAEEWARRQRTREQAIASVGSLRRLPPLPL